jgi:CRISPR-associated protein Cmr2
MNSYLLKLSIGPVQGFIAAARRSRDLWFGSYILSAAAKRAALSLKGNGATLIFPNDEDEGLLDSGPGRQISNVIFAKVETDAIKELVKQIKAAANQAWLHEAGLVFDEAEYLARKDGQKRRRKHNPLNQALWNQQLNDVLEFYAAWAALLPDDKADYQEKYEVVDRLLAARKNTRDFLPAQNTLFGIQKSSLDAGRESVILSRRSKLDTLRLRRQWGIGDGEELDCPGFVKRVGGKLALRAGENNRLEHFTPLSRIALDPWIRGMDQEKKEKLAKLVDSGLFDTLQKYDLATPVKGNVKDGASVYQDFPYDGQLLYDFRLTAEMAKAGTHLRNQLQELKQAAAPLFKDGKPDPYLALLQADGDYMGKLLSHDNSCALETHRNISKALAAFAADAQSLVQKRQGHAIYAGGDDVLALLPLDQAIDCAEALRKRFEKLLQPFGEGLRDQPTLSVGLAIGHFLEPLPVLLDMARRAERLAKGDGLDAQHRRNALGIVLKPRSGGEIEARSQWGTDPAQRLAHWAQAFRDGRLPERTPYLLREAAQRLGGLGQESGAYKSALDASARRIVQRRRMPGGGEDEERQKQEALRKKLLDAATKKDGIGLAELVSELLIARRIAQALDQANAAKTEDCDAT